MLCHTWQQQFGSCALTLTLLCLVSVNVKWGKEKFDAVELNTEEPPMVFKAQLFALTGVQPDRQKVMVKGGTLKVPMSTTTHTLLKLFVNNTVLEWSTYPMKNAKSYLAPTTN